VQPVEGNGKYVNEHQLEGGQLLGLGLRQNIQLYQFAARQTDSFGSNRNLEAALQDAYKVPSRAKYYIWILNGPTLEIISRTEIIGPFQDRRMAPARKEGFG
jgi:hypothetical protein